MQCDRFEQILIEQDEGPLPKQALAHIDECESCRALTADLTAIHDVGLEIGGEGIVPPERVWVSLRNQLEAEHIIRDARTLPVRVSIRSGWWAAFQRPALAGSFLALILVAAGLISYRGYQGSSSQSAIRQQSALEQEVSPMFSADGVFKQESLSVGNDLLPGLQKRDAAVTDSIRRNLDIVDNFIALCEKSVREQPDNQMAREYLYGAYQQKAEVLATAMNRGTSGGLQ
ncbi:MAG: hypothetical protein ABSA96_10880 [Candidatus Acidiferrales bacterium]|jgi:hypothetical protein